MHGSSGAGINITNSVAGGPITVIQIAHQASGTAISSLPNGQSIIDPAFTSQLADQIGASLCLPQEFSNRVRIWETEVQRLMDDFDSQSLRQLSQEFETWFSDIRQRLPRNERAKCLVLLARLQIYFDGERDAEANL